MTLYLDMDGVLADFDALAERVLETDNTYKFEHVWGPKEFWRQLNLVPTFWDEIPLMVDAYVLHSAVEHLQPYVLTALPHAKADDVRRAKLDWIETKFGKELRARTICTTTKEKPNYCSPGDIIIDDRAINKPAWEAKGGRYIVHTDAASSLAQLKAWGVI